jgi:hypothetical protein
LPILAPKFELFYINQVKATAPAAGRSGPLLAQGQAAAVRSSRPAAGAGPKAGEMPTLKHFFVKKNSQKHW